MIFCFLMDIATNSVNCPIGQLSENEVDHGFSLSRPIHWADSVIESQCPSAALWVCGFVCPL